MLLRIIFENFLSFNSPVEFDMFPNLKRTTLLSHVYDKEKMPILKMSSIYGPNGAGKSNFIKGISFVRNFAVKSGYVEGLRKTGDFARLFYAFKEKKEPIKILIEFSNADQFFIYSFEISSRGVEKEKLMESGLGKKENRPIFERHGSSVVFGSNSTETILTASKKLLSKNPFASLLSLNQDFPIIEESTVGKAFGWFSKKLDIIDIMSQLPTLIDLLRNNKEMMEFTNRVFQRCGLGIDNVSVKEEDFDSWARNHALLANFIPSLGKNEGFTLFNRNRQAYSVLRDKVYRLAFLQEGEGGYSAELDTLSQSDGTIRLLTLIPAIYKAINKDQTIVIDEINHCLHPSIVEGIVKLFAKNKTTKGQLIFSSHDIDLLDVKDVLRSDEIWFADKKNGATFMYSHNDFKEHNTISKGKGYKEGRFGAIHYMKEENSDDEIF